MSMIGMMLTIPLAAVAVAQAGSPAVAEPVPAAADTADVVSATEYLCDDGQRLLTTRGGDPPRTLLSVRGRPDLQDIELHDASSANGLRTSNGTWVWWTRGDEGFLAEDVPPAGTGKIVIDGCRDILAPP